MGKFRKTNFRVALQTWVDCQAWTRFNDLSLWNRIAVKRFVSRYILSQSYNDIPMVCLVSIMPKVVLQDLMLMMAKETD